MEPMTDQRTTEEKEGIALPTTASGPAAPKTPSSLRLRPFVNVCHRRHTLREGAPG
eukprot:CAMPEP_0197446560 /NCGR_PEP_ID=MMETSP1175-20131217/11489_1 /TAXON_ID=1003142 /ORGANISM="Triceratium dubium, Strain CCMP147" /LENGTH=55 /DNA_ID=CAMNT_0042977703 /DNA_START=109 /DNA_END=273 /DNA_ORIENTATION=-